MSTCKHKWKKEPFAGSLKCAKCGHVEFDVAGECLSLQAKVEEMQAAIAECMRELDTYNYLTDKSRDNLKKFLPEEE